jgi:hypothetical protein
MQPWLLEGFCRHHRIFAVLNTIRCEGAFREFGSFLLACMQCTHCIILQVYCAGGTYLFSCINYLWGCMLSHPIGCVKFLFFKLLIISLTLANYASTCIPISITSHVILFFKIFISYSPNSLNRKIGEK